MKQQNSNGAHITAMSAEHAGQISGWAYPGKYAVYSFTPANETIAELMNGEYYVCLDSHQALIGYFCFGQSARIPTVEQDAYTDDALDIGLGMNPELCGQGQGYAFVQAGLDFARREFTPDTIRLSVAAFNQRASRLYGRHGFRYTKSVIHARSHKLFFVMEYRCQTD